MMQSYPDIVKMALKVLISFPTSYECETAFSTLLATKVSLSTIGESQVGAPVSLTCVSLMARNKYMIKLPFL